MRGVLASVIAPSTVQPAVIEAVRWFALNTESLEIVSLL